MRTPSRADDYAHVDSLMRSSLASIVLCLLVAAGCGSQETGAPARTQPAASRAATASPGKAAGVTDGEFSAVQLRTQRAVITKRFGRPRATSKPDPASECLDYWALDDPGRRVQNLTYRFCCDRTGRMSVRTTVSSTQ